MNKQLDFHARVGSSKLLFLKRSQILEAALFICICSPPPRHAKMHILPIYPSQLLGNDCENPKIQKSKNLKIQKSKKPQIQKSKNPKIKKSKNQKMQKNARFRRCKKFWIFGILEFEFFDMCSVCVLFCVLFVCCAWLLVYICSF